MQKFPTFEAAQRFAVFYQGEFFHGVN